MRGRGQLVSLIPPAVIFFPSLVDVPKANETNTPFCCALGGGQGGVVTQTKTQTHHPYESRWHGMYGKLTETVPSSDLPFFVLATVRPGQSSGQDPFPQKPVSQNPRFQFQDSPNLEGTPWAGLSEHKVSDLSPPPCNGAPDLPLCHSPPYGHHSLQRTTPKRSLGPDPSHTQQIKVGRLST